MRTNYLDSIIDFILSEPTEYLSIAKETFNQDELFTLLEVPEFGEENCITLLQFVKESISIKDKPYTDAVKVYILQHNFSAEDLDYLIGNYGSEPECIQTEIERHCQKNISAIISKKITFSLDLLLDLLADTQIQNKIQLFINHLPSLEFDKTKKCFEVLKMNDCIGLFDGKKHRIENNQHTEIILKILQEKKWISSYESEENPDEDGKHYFQVIGKKRK